MNQPAARPTISLFLDLNPASHSSPRGERRTRRARGRRLAALVGAAAVLGGLGGCASISVQPETGSRPTGAGGEPGRPPAKLIVTTFESPRGALRVNRDGEDLTRFQQVLSVNLRQETAKRLAELGLPVEVADADQVGRLPRQAAWLITGRFNRVNQGSRALRVGIGLGAGGTKMETAVQAYDLSRPGDLPVVAFRTTGGSNAEPGLIASVGGGPVSTAVSAALTVAGSIGHGVTADTRRTARMTAAYISEALAERGHLDPARVKRAKRLGGER